MNRSRLFTIAIFLFSCLAAPTRVTQGQTPFSEEAAVKAGQEGLRRTHEFPWYDPQRDAIRRLDVQPPDDMTSRHSKWVYRQRTWTWPAWFKYFFQGLLWLILTFVVVFLLYSLLRALGWVDWDVRGSGSESQEPARGDADRVEALPFTLQSPKADLFAEARRYYEAGSYNQAMIYLYSYQLVQLDRHHVIRLTKGKTNRQYLREMKPRREIWELMRVSMIAFEDVFFGHYPLDRDRFERCWNRLDEFQSFLEPVAV